MKLQLSLEMQLYLVIAMIAALFSLHEFTAAYPYINGRLSWYTEEEFIVALDGSILSGNLSFSSYIPEGMCNATMGASVFTTAYGKFRGISEMEDFFRSALLTSMYRKGGTMSIYTE